MSVRYCCYLFLFPCCWVFFCWLYDKLPLTDIQVYLDLDLYLDLDADRGSNLYTRFPHCSIFRHHNHHSYVDRQPKCIKSFVVSPKNTVMKVNFVVYQCIDGSGYKNKGKWFKRNCPFAVYPDPPSPETRIYVEIWSSPALEKKKKHTSRLKLSWKWGKRRLTAELPKCPCVFVCLYITEQMLYSFFAWIGTCI